MIYARKNRTGFTIVELLIVIVVIGIIAGITIISYSAVTNNAKKQTAKTDAQTAAGVLTKYKSENGAYPANLSDAGEIKSVQSTYQYTYNSTADTYCLTASVSGASAHLESGNSKAEDGGCAGHGVNGQDPITNLATNPSMETSIAGWGAYTGVAAPTRVTTTPLFGSARLSAVGNNTAVSPRATIDIGSIASGDRVSVSFYVRSDGQTPTSGFLVYKLINGTTEVSTFYSYSPTWSPAANGWMRVKGEATIPAGGNGLRVNFGVNTVANYTGTLGVDGVMIVKATGDYQFADGNSTNWAWTGTQNLSSSSGPAL